MGAAMCVEVRRTDVTVPGWNREDLAIDVPEELTYGQTLLVVRDILTRLGARQPTMETMRATCYCGETVTVQALKPIRWRAPVHSLFGARFMEVSRGA